MANMVFVFVFLIFLFFFHFFLEWLTSLELPLSIFLLILHTS